jgi:IS30 family transposase
MHSTINLNDGWVRGVKSKINGELVKSSKLTNNDVIIIKQLISEGVLSNRKIGEQYNVEPQTIDKIKRGLTWSHI